MKMFVLGELTPSQYPVFTIYLQKTCLASAGSCKAAWSFERVMEHSLAVDPLETANGATDRQACMEACLAQPLCRYNNKQVKKVLQTTSRGGA